MSTSNIIELKSSDGETFEVEEVVAIESQTIKHVIEDGCADTSIPLPNVTSKILAMVIEYCKRHVDSSTFNDKIAEDELKNFKAEFVKVDHGTLFDLILKLCPSSICWLWRRVRDEVIIYGTFLCHAASTYWMVGWWALAANYLNVKSLLDLTCQTVADKIKGKTPEEIYKMFNITSVFTPEEEELVRRENASAFE